MGGSVKQGQAGHLYHHWEGKSTELPGKMSLLWLPVLPCSTHTGTEGAGAASQLGWPHSGVSPESFSGAEIRLSTGSIQLCIPTARLCGYCPPTWTFTFPSISSKAPNPTPPAAEDGVWLGHMALQTPGWFQDKTSCGAAHTEPTGVSVWGKVSDKLQAGWDPALRITHGGSEPIV